MQQKFQSKNIFGWKCVEDGSIEDSEYYDDFISGIELTSPILEGNNAKRSFMESKIKENNKEIVK